MLTHRLLWLAMLGVLLGAFACACADTTVSAPPVEERRLTVDFHEAALKEILDDLLNGSYVLEPKSLGERRVTLSLRDVPFSAALREVAKAARVSLFRQDGGFWEARDQRLVTLDLRNASLADALRVAFQGTIYSYALDSPTYGDRKLTMSLQEVPVDQAVDLIASGAGLTCEQVSDRVWLFRDKPASVTIGGKSVPVLGAMTAEQYLKSLPRQPVVTVTPNGELRPGDGGDAGRSMRTPREIRQPLTMPGLQNELITFEARDLPLREAMAKLTAKTGHDVYVPAAVPDAVRLTARVYLVPVQDFLQSVAQQARLWLRYTLVDAAGKPAPWVTIEPGGAKMILLQPSSENKLHYRFCLAPDSLLGITDGARVLRPFSGYSHSSKDRPDYFGPDPVDLDVQDVSLRAAMAKLAAASGYDIVVSEAVPTTLKVSVSAYCQPARWILDRIAEGAGLEIREQLLSAKGEPLPPEMAQVSPTTIEEMKKQGRVHTRYTLVPKSEIKVSGPGVPLGDLSELHSTGVPPRLRFNGLQLLNGQTPPTADLTVGDVELK